MKSLFKLLLIIFVVVFAILSLIWLKPFQESSTKPDITVVAVTQIVAHPAVDSVREGIKEVLTRAGYKDGENLRWIYENAHGNIATANQIAHKFAGLNPHVIVAITTPSALAVLSAVGNTCTPVVFAAVTDPVEAKLVDTLDRPGKNVTGTSDKPPIKEQIALIREILGTEKSIHLGILYNSGEANSVQQVEIASQAAQELGIKVTVRSVDNATKVLAAAQSLLSDVDAIYVPLDNVVASALPALVNICLNNPMGKKIPVFASDPEGVRQGAIATVGFTHYDEGLLAGAIVLRILGGEPAETISVQSPHPASIYLNKTSAEKLGITLPADLMEQAKEIL